ncbi:MAG: type II secretion system protein [Betaproteobacteria bacterium]|nr:type II secretion system protein [Betaproteobacteria bacterium]
MQVLLTRGRGFSLLEMIIVVVLLGIVGAAIGGFILPAVRAYQAQGQRAALVDAGESALRRLARDVRISLPNSLRITNTGSGFALEMVPTADGARYCTTGVADCSSGNVLTIGSSDNQFDVLGCFQNASFTGSPAGYRLVIGDSSGQFYSAAGTSAVATPTSTTISLSIFPGTGGTPTQCGTASATANSYNRYRLTLTAGQTFPNASSRQRVFVVQSSALPVSYICDTTAQTLTRYSGYTVQATQPTTAAAIGAATTAVVATSLTACSLTSTTTDVQSTGLLTLTLGLTRAGETVQLMHQVQLDNSL